MINTGLCLRKPLARNSFPTELDILAGTKNEAAATTGHERMGGKHQQHEQDRKQQQQQQNENENENEKRNERETVSLNSPATDPPPCHSCLAVACPTSTMQLHYHHYHHYQHTIAIIPE
jgi:exopolyphosphatase/pppGpp-phosphohydrolase